MSRIKYIGYYDIDLNEERGACLASNTKMDYICEALVATGNDVEIISLLTTSKVARFSASLKQIKENIWLRKFSARRRSSSRIIRGLALYFDKVRLFIRLFFLLKRTDVVISYHSLASMWMMATLHKLIGFRLILEVEEIYNDVIKKSDKLRAKEIKALQAADAYILPCKELNDVVNAERRPYCVVHGTYHVEPKRYEQASNGLHHIVYAGTLDPRKGGAAAAAAAAAYLPPSCHVHILGFGSEKQKENITNIIAEVSKNKSCAKVSFDGLKSGEDYIRFLQSCEIGLSTQNPDADFNATSFPSKVLVYLANGLKVVSIRIPVIENSDVGDNLFYYNHQVSDEIARAILVAIDAESMDSRVLISQLDMKFKSELHDVVERLYLEKTKC